MTQGKYAFRFNYAHPVNVGLSRATEIRELIAQAAQFGTQGAPGHAAQCYERILGLEPCHINALKRLAEITWNLKMFGRSLELQDRLIALEPQHSAHRFGRGLLLWEMQRWEEARVAYSEAIESLPPQVAAGPARPQYLGARLALRGGDCSVEDEVWKESIEFLVDPAIHLAHKELFLKFAGLVIVSPEPWKEKLLSVLVIPSIESALFRREYLCAHMLASITMTATALHPHTREQWARCMVRLNPLFAAAGERERAQLPALQLPDDVPENIIVALVADYAVAFGSGLTVFETMLDDFGQASLRRFTPVVYALNSPTQELRSACLRNKIRFIDMDQERGRIWQEDDLRGRLLNLRERMRQDGVAVAIFYSTYEWLVSLASSLGLAPVQLYHSMMFNSIAAPRIDAYLAHNSLTKGWKMIEGRYWRTLTLPNPDPFPKEGSPDATTSREAAATARERILEGKYRVILGSMTRPEKLDEGFVDALAIILKAHSDAIFVWFGLPDVPPANIVAKFAERGISDQCKYMGWVNTRIFAKVIDIHLDPFNLPAGNTMVETFFAGGAYVLKISEEAMNIGLASILMQIQTERDDEELIKARELFRHPTTSEFLLMLADTPAQYVALANRLIEDRSFRFLVGSAIHRFMDYWFQTPGRFTKYYGEHISEALALKRTSSSTST